jgi:hypothetical protein
MVLRKIKSQEEIAARDKKIRLFAVIFMASLLLLSTAGYFASELFGNKGQTSLNKINYGGLTYFIQDNFYVLEMEGRDFYFFDLPNASRGLYLNSSSFENYVGKPIYVVNINSAIQTTLLNLEGTYSRWQEACLEEGCGENLPVKNCSENIIVFEEGEIDKVKREGNCLFIYGNPEKGVDAISYNLLGIK